MKMTFHPRLALIALAALSFTTLTLAQTDVEARFKTALEKRESGDYEASIEGLQGILANQPQLGRARIELALSYFKALNYAKAKAEAERVLNDPNTPDMVKISVRDLLAAIAAESRPHEFTPFITLGYLYDTNLNVGPGSDTININGTALTLAAGSTRRSDSALVAHAGFGHRYLMPESVSLFGFHSAALWQSSAGYYVNDYQNSNDFDLQVVSLSTGPALLAAKRWRASLPLQFDMIHLGSQHTADYLGLTPTVTWIRDKTELTVDGQYQNRRYIQAADTGRNGDFVALGLSAAHLFANDKISMQGGAKVFSEHTTDARFSNNGTEVYAGLGWRAWKGGNLFVRVAEKQSRYVGVEPLFNVARDERESRQTVGATHEFSGSMLDKWLLSLTYANTRNRSNVSIYTYDREQTMLTLGRSF